MIMVKNTIAWMLQICNIVLLLKHFTGRTRGRNIMCFVKVLSFRVDARTYDRG